MTWAEPGGSDGRSGLYLQLTEAQSLDQDSHLWRECIKHLMNIESVFKYRAKKIMDIGLQCVQRNTCMHPGKVTGTYQISLSILSLIIVKRTNFLCYKSNILVKVCRHLSRFTGNTGLKPIEISCTPHSFCRVRSLLWKWRLVQSQMCETQ